MATNNDINANTNAIFKSIVVQVFTGAGTYTYTPTTGMIYCIVEGVSGGGGGGYARGAATGSAAGGGGSGGGYGRTILTAAQIGASKTVTIGAAGAGGVAATSTAGTAGTNTTLSGALFAARFGSAGLLATASTLDKVSLGGVTSIIGAAGDVKVSGYPGRPGLSTATGANMAAGGNGGGTLYGGGGKGAAGDSTGQSATSYGGGGAGASTISNVNRDGGAGADGIMIIYEFISAAQ